jgi:hypothetical protein
MKEQDEENYDRRSNNIKSTLKYTTIDHRKKEERKKERLYLFLVCSLLSCFGFSGCCLLSFFAVWVWWAFFLRCSGYEL